MKTLQISIALIVGIAVLAWANQVGFPGGLFDKSPDGSCWKIDVDNTGTVSTSSSTAYDLYCSYPAVN